MHLVQLRARVAATAAGAVAVVTALLAAPATAEPGSGPPAGGGLTALQAAAAGAASLEESLGAAGAGTYVDASGAVVVNVTTAAAAKAVTAAGAVPRIVANSEASLAAVTATLDATTATPGTAWAVDPVRNAVVVSLDESVSAADAARVQAVVASFGKAVVVERIPGTLTTTIIGGEAIYGTAGRCSLGFNVQNSSGQRYFLTAGHCTDIISSWYANSARTAYLGPTVGSSFPGDDYGLVRHDSTGPHYGRVSLYNGSYQDITRSANAFVGEQVRRSGSTTGLRGGQVTALNATVNYAEGQVRGLIRTTVCAQGGDSGGSLFDGSTALGLTSGGSGNCSVGGTTYFQPVTEALGVYGVSVY